MYYPLLAMAVGGSVILLTVIIEMYRKRRQSNKEPASDEPDPELLADIEAAADVDDLMDIVEDYDDFYGEENDALLRKALSFGGSVTEEDWAAIYVRSGQESQLERVAYQKAGKTLFN